MVVGDVQPNTSLLSAVYVYSLHHAYKRLVDGCKVSQRGFKGTALQGQGRHWLNVDHVTQPSKEGERRSDNNYMLVSLLSKFHILSASQCRIRFDIDIVGLHDLCMND